MAVNTVVYNPDGSFNVTARAASGMIIRFIGTYQAEPVGANQWRITTQLGGMFPQQVCTMAPSGASSCSALPVPPAPPPTVVIATGNTLQDGTVTASRDPSPVLAVMQVPAVIMNPVSVAGGGGGSGGIEMCTLGSTQCFVGWQRTCERWPSGGTWWKTSAVRCGR